MQEQRLDVSARESAIGFCFFVHIAFNTHLFSISLRKKSQYQEGVNIIKFADH